MDTDSFDATSFNVQRGGSPKNFSSGQSSAQPGDDSLEDYGMQEGYSRKCLIINHYKFPFEDKHREGSEADVLRVKELFQFLGFQVNSNICFN